MKRVMELRGARAVRMPGDMSPLKQRNITREIGRRSTLRRQLDAVREIRETVTDSEATMYAAHLCGYLAGEIEEIEGRLYKAGCRFE